MASSGEYSLIIKLTIVKDLGSHPGPDHVGEDALQILRYRLDTGQFGEFTSGVAALVVNDIAEVVRWDISPIGDIVETIDNRPNLPDNL